MRNSIHLTVLGSGKRGQPGYLYNNLSEHNKELTYDIASRIKTENH